MKNRIIAAFLLSIFIYPLELIAEDAFFEVRGKNELLEIAVAPGTPKTDRAIIWFVSEGNVSLPVDVYLEGPAGVRAVLESGKGGKKPASRVLSRQGFIQVNTLRRLRIRKTGAYARASSQDAPHYIPQATELGLPEGCTQELYDQYLTFIQLNPEFAAYDPSVFCGTLSENPGPTDPGSSDNGSGVGEPPLASNGTVSTLGLVRKNTCSGGAKDKYIVRLIINFKKVSADLLNTGFAMRVALNERPYRGDMMSSIKDRSDGMFRGRPLSLLHTLGYSSYGERETLLKWKGAKIRSAESIKIHDYVPYRGMSLARADISRYMSGGYGVFELFNGINAYSVCFELRARRQFANGYPEIE